MGKHREQAVRDLSAFMGYIPEHVEDCAMLAYEFLGAEDKAVRYAIDQREDALEKDELLAQMVEIWDGDACLLIQASNIDAIVWHLERGEDNAGLSKATLAQVFANVVRMLQKTSKALAAYRSQLPQKEQAK